jgi:hypothetical protein
MSHDSLCRAKTALTEPTPANPLAHREASSALELARVNACPEGNRHQPAALLACTLELGVFLTARAPNRRRWSPAFGGRDDAGSRSRNTRERKWTRPHYSSSSSWCCCSAAVDSSTDAGLESEGRLARRDQSPPNGRCTAPTGCRRSWRDRRPYTSRGLRSTHRSTARSPGTRFFVRRKSRQPVRARL